MTFITRLFALSLLISAACFAQTPAPAPQQPPVPAQAPTAPEAPAAPRAPTPAEQLKLAMLEALVAAPDERSMPIVGRVLRDPQSSPELKQRALFVLSHIDAPEAESMLLDIARSPDDTLRHDAIRSIGISGSADALGALADLYRSGGADVRESVLEAYLIAHDTGAVYELALAATTEDEFSNAVEALGAMGAQNELRALRESAEWTDSLINAYAIAGDTETLLEMAQDADDPAQQVRAINGLAVAAGDEAADVFSALYRETDNGSVREAALEALLINNAEAQVLALFRNSADPKEQRRLLELLVAMDSDAAWDVIDTALQD